jgi:hypothetical protein
VFSFRFTPAYRLAGLPFMVTPGRCAATVDESELSVRFGLWAVRTELANVCSSELIGPFSFLKTAGPAHLSLADRGLTFATNPDRGLCIRFREPVAGIEPTGSGVRMDVSREQVATSPGPPTARSNPPAPRSKAAAR